MAFQKPDAKTIERMTPQSLTALLSALKQRRREAIEPLNEQIEYYENLLKEKQDKNAKTAS